MANPISPPADSRTLQAESEDSPSCVMTFNASDPSGAGGLTADITAIASAGGHPLAVVTGAYVRDTAEIFDCFAFDEEAVTEQARTALEDMSASAIKVGFVGSPENISTIAEIASDYADVPLIAYMPNLSWWDESEIDSYLDAFRELMLPQTTVLVGNHSSLWRWLLPDWSSERNPSAKDIAKAASEFGVPYTLVTGIPQPDQFIDNVLATPQAVLYSERFERFEAIFAGAGDTLSAALAALLANGHDLQAATAEALTYLDQSLDGGFHPGMGNIVPDRLFWAQADVDAEDAEPEEAPEPDDAALTLNPSKPFFDLPPNGTTKH
ncbi:MAG: putative phosphomethylpyrimidine kinase [Polaromonas sp.]|nr:putative phosphomethylpyrimidine kinase [Polaromonas sp.]